MSSDHIEIKSDKRFKHGHIKRKGNQLRGNPETMKIELMKNVPAGIIPPLVVGAELGGAIRKAMK